MKFLNIILNPYKRVSRSGYIIIGPGYNDGPVSSLTSVLSALPLPLLYFDLIGFYLGRPPRNRGSVSGSWRSNVVDVGVTLGVSDITRVS